MPSNYAGSSAVYHSNITLPNDGDARSAASVNVGLQGLADRAAWLKANGGANRPIVQLDYITPGSTTVFLVPANVRWVWVFVMGGGGAGGNGATGDLAGIDRYPGGGGGGGGAIGHWHLRTVTPGSNYEAFCAGGGTPGAVTSGIPGGDGGNSFFQKQGGTEQVIGYGASGGRSGVISTNTIDGGFSPGGGPALATRRAYTSAGGFVYPTVCASDGGFSGTSNITDLGGTSPAGRACPGQFALSQLDNGGVALGGTKGTTIASYRGASGGGGGGSSTMGSGGAGGAGGNGSNGGVGLTGAAGASATLAGSGGGGGGGGGGGSSAGSVGGQGGAGMSGLVRIFYISPVAT